MAKLETQLRDAERVGCRNLSCKARGVDVDLQGDPARRRNRRRYGEPNRDGDLPTDPLDAGFEGSTDPEVVTRLCAIHGPARSTSFANRRESRAPRSSRRWR